MQLLEEDDLRPRDLRCLGVVLAAGRHVLGTRAGAAPRLGLASLHGLRRVPRDRSLRHAPQRSHWPSEPGSSYPEDATNPHPPTLAGRRFRLKGEQTISTREFTKEEARAIGQRIGVDWSAGDVDLEQFRMGLAIELEHQPGPGDERDQRRRNDHREDRAGTPEGDPRLLHASGRDGAGGNGSETLSELDQRSSAESRGDASWRQRSETWRHNLASRASRCGARSPRPRSRFSADVTPAGEPRSSGVVYRTLGRRLYVAVAPDSWKARHVAVDGRVSLTVPVTGAASSPS